MKNYLNGFLLLLTVLLFVSCLEYEEKITLDADGSGTIQMKYAVDKVYLNQMKEMYKQMAQNNPSMGIPEDPSETMFNKDQIESDLANEDNSIKLIHYEKSENEKAQIWDMKFSFGDINKLDALMAALSPEDDYENGEEYNEQVEEVITIFTKQPDGTLLYNRPFEEYGSMEEEEYYGDYDEGYSEEDSNDEEENSEIGQEIEEGVEQIGEALSEMTKGMEDNAILFQITFPGEIMESNATSVDGNTAIWKYKLTDLNSPIPNQHAIIKP